MQSLAGRGFVRVAERTMATPPSGHATVSVVGVGHAGLIVAAGLASLGHRVTGIDANDALITKLRRGMIESSEVGLPPLVLAGLADGSLRFQSSWDEDASSSEFVFISVNTPAGNAGQADLSDLRSVVESLVARPPSRDALIVNRTTCPVGTSDWIEGELRRAHDDWAPSVVSCPEFLREGTGLHDFLFPSRIVVGAQSRSQGERVASLFAGIAAPIVYTDRRSAELGKYAANAFLAARVSFVNEIAKICDALDCDIDSVVDALLDDPRIGPTPLVSGVGFGGNCLPKDLAALRFQAGARGVPTPLLDAITTVNEHQKHHTIVMIRSAVGPLRGARIAVIGLSFKAGTVDWRGSPALDLVERLKSEGAHVRIFDRLVCIDMPSDLRNLMCRTALEAAQAADLVALLNDDETLLPDLTELRRAMRQPIVFDGRNALDEERIRSEGFRYLAFGRNRDSARLEEEPNPCAVSRDC